LVNSHGIKLMICGLVGARQPRCVESRQGQCGLVLNQLHFRSEANARCLVEAGGFFTREQVWWFGRWLILVNGGQGG
jgi:hypothetical protein